MNYKQNYINNWYKNPLFQIFALKFEYIS